MKGKTMSISRSYNTRCTSFPSRLQDPKIRVLEEEIKKLNSSISVNSGSIRDHLSSLGEIYRYLEEVFKLPIMSQVKNNQYPTWLNSMLDDLIKYLDVCGNTRDLIIIFKEKVVQLQSIFRRSKSGNVELIRNIEGETYDYISFRKNMKKEIVKSLASLKQTQDQIVSSSTILMDSKLNNNLGYYMSCFVRLLKELSLVTIDVFYSLLLFLNVAKFEKPKKSSKWSLVTKFVNNKNYKLDQRMLHEEEQERFIELEIVDIEVNSFLGFIKTSRDVEANYVQSSLWKLQVLENKIEELEIELKCLFRWLIHTRVSLLNILSQ